VPTEGEIRTRLEERHLELERIRDAARPPIADEFDGPSDEPSHQDQHPADVASELLERSVDFSVVEMAEGALKDVELALRNLEKGTYGLCEVCGQPIPQARLEALPEARFCVEHAPSAAA
jgi:RNA polymerase-binding transcription factor DksA